MPTVGREGEFEFVVHTREHAFESPHVHVRLSDGTDVRIELAGGTFMRPDEFKVPSGKGGEGQTFILRISS